MPACAHIFIMYIFQSNSSSSSSSDRERWTTTHATTQDILNKQFFFFGIELWLGILGWWCCARLSWHAVHIEIRSNDFNLDHFALFNPYFHQQFIVSFVRHALQSGWCWRKPAYTIIRPYTGMYGRCDHLRTMISHRIGNYLKGNSKMYCIN